MPLFLERECAVAVTQSRTLLSLLPVWGTGSSLIRHVHVRTCFKLLTHNPGHPPSPPLLSFCFHRRCRVTSSKQYLGHTGSRGVHRAANGTVHGERAVGQARRAGPPLRAGRRGGSRRRHLLLTRKLAGVDAARSMIAVVLVPCAVFVPRGLSKRTEAVVHAPYVYLDDEARSSGSRFQKVWKQGTFGGLVLTRQPWMLCVVVVVVVVRFHS